MILQKSDFSMIFSKFFATAFLRHLTDLAESIAAYQAKLNFKTTSMKTKTIIVY